MAAFRACARRCQSKMLKHEESGRIGCAAPPEKASGRGFRNLSAGAIHIFKTKDRMPPGVVRSH